MIMPPCKKDGFPCTKREVGCQSTCPEMQEYLKKVNDANTTRRRVKMLDLYVADSRKRLKKCDSPLPSVNLKNKRKRRERSARYNAQTKKIVKPGSSDACGRNS